ncbi:MAG: 16S rRNA (guanine(527)-N(7))-methyltransferase RsmG [Pseudomonadota bacterium]
MKSLDAVGLTVSRETIEKLDAFSALLTRWNRKINLVSPREIDRLWDRHILDSAQVFPHVPDDVTSWADVGSGAGLPGLVCAILAAEKNRDLVVDLIESDQRKCVFLRQASRELGLETRVHAERVEAVAPKTFQIITARAFASVPKILTLTAPLRGETTRYLLLKGRSYESELTEAEQSWKLHASRIPSRTDPDGMILDITEVYPRHDVP